MSGGAEDRNHSLRPPAQPGQVSLFRPGQPRLEGALMLDQRSGREMTLTAESFAAPNPSRVWESIGEIRVNPDLLARNGLFLKPEQQAASGYFDMLRTRVAQAMAKEGWRSLAVTSPGPGCGKSFVAANLALALSRLPSCRTVLMDLALREPHLGELFAQEELQPLTDFLLGDQPLEAHFRRLGPNLALALNGAPVARAAETLQDPVVGQTLEAMAELLQPDMVIYDTAPALHSDEVISLAGRVDAVLLVIDGTRTAPEEISACERLLEGRIPLLAVVLNRAQDRRSWLRRPGRAALRPATSKA